MTDLGRVPHAIVEDLERPRLDDVDRHHLTRSLRMRRDDELTVTDGVGRWRLCRLGDDLDPVGEVRVVARPDPPICIALARTKGHKPELAVQKLTELGVDRIIVFDAVRSVARLADDRADKQLDRLRRVVREAAMQSRRVHLPIVEFVDDLRGVLAAEPALARADIGDDRGGLDLETASVAIGPEGGWDDTEREAVARSVRLSDHVLRAETAAITAGAVLATLRSGMTAKL